jgi:hypothetical protein
MGLLTWVIVGIVVLAIIGLGWQIFFPGVTKGAEKVLSNPTVKKASNQAKEFLANVTNNVTKGIGKELTSSK